MTDIPIHAIQDDLAANLNTVGEDSLILYSSDYEPNAEFNTSLGIKKFCLILIYTVLGERLGEPTGHLPDTTNLRKRLKRILDYQYLPKPYRIFTIVGRTTTGFTQMCLVSQLKDKSGSTMRC